MCDHKLLNAYVYAILWAYCNVFHLNVYKIIRIWIWFCIRLESRYNILQSTILQFFHARILGPAQLPTYIHFPTVGRLYCLVSIFGDQGSQILGSQWKGPWGPKGSWVMGGRYGWKNLPLFSRWVIFQYISSGCFYLKEPSNKICIGGPPQDLGFHVDKHSCDPFWIFIFRWNRQMALAWLKRNYCIWTHKTNGNAITEMSTRPSQLSQMQLSSPQPTCSRAWTRELGIWVVDLIKFGIWQNNILHKASHQVKGVVHT